MRFHFGSVDLMKLQKAYSLGVAWFSGLKEAERERDEIEKIVRNEKDDDPPANRGPNRALVAPVSDGILRDFGHVALDFLFNHFLKK
jgi:hypothetical protein